MRVIFVCYFDRLASRDQQRTSQPHYHLCMFCHKLRKRLGSSCSGSSHGNRGRRADGMVTRQFHQLLSLLRWNLALTTPWTIASYHWWVGDLAKASSAAATSERRTMSSSTNNFLTFLLREDAGKTDSLPQEGWKMTHHGWKICHRCNLKAAARTSSFHC